ncbi:12197_t:CDS:2 [Racocetra fulgida]|uniref:12197_t:CDS:1 n=1 Tax=Racocetra fulgida TaxID=60492 RepID=A0A9N9AB93_9GLOM|nr:12197_t:CDS:2 [Racocetra fulgida]
MKFIAKAVAQTVIAIFRKRKGRERSLLPSSSSNSEATNILKVLTDEQKFHL